MTNKQKYGLVAALVVFLFSVGIFRLYQQGRLPNSWNLPSPPSIIQDNRTQTLVTEENAIIDTVEKSSPSVIAIGVNQRIINPFNPLSGTRSQEQTIGTGFVVSDKNIIVTNRHVVSDPNMKYTVVTKDGKKLEVTKIYRDPVLDLALVQVNDLQGLKPLELGDSSKTNSS